MSDGPHKSLPMQQHWRDCSRDAARPASSAGEVRQSFERALKREISPAAIEALRQVVGNGAQASLYANDREQLAQALESCRIRFPGEMSTQSLFNSAIVAARRGEPPANIDAVAIEATLRIVAESQSRGIEEHYGRKTSEANTLFVRDRLRAAGAETDYRSLAKELAQSAGGSPLSASVKRSGVDEGPALPGALSNE